VGGWEWNTATHPSPFSYLTLTHLSSPLLSHKLRREDEEGRGEAKNSLRSVLLNNNKNKLTKAHTYNYNA
jgi:hypothetical protein